MTDPIDSAELTRTLEAITRGAVDALPDVQAASITVSHTDGSLETRAQTDDVLTELDAIQYRLREGPCYQAAVEDLYVVATDLATDSRFPRYGPAATERGIRAQAGLALFQRARSRAALNLYAGSRGALRDVEALAPLLAHQATMTLGYALEVDNLRQAIDTRASIGRAVGIVMERYQVPEDRAFAFLARLSQDQNVKLRQVARNMVDSVPGDAEPSRSTP
jgi:hypothetical protein